MLIFISPHIHTDQPVYDAVEVHSMTVHLNFELEYPGIEHQPHDSRDNKEPSAWSVFLHCKEGGTMTLCDCDSREAALIVARLVEANIGAVQELKL